MAEGQGVRLQDPDAIYRASFARIREEAPIDRLPADFQAMALRLIHSCGMPDILGDLAWTIDAVRSGRTALAAGAPILVDATMVKAGIQRARLPAANPIVCALDDARTPALAATLRTTRSAAAVDLWRERLDGAPILVDATMVSAGIQRARLPAANPIVCTLDDARTPALAAELRTTRSAAAVDLWRERLDGAVIAIGNAPTALFRLLDLLADGAPAPALVLGFPVGFIGATEAKDALIAHGRGGSGPELPYVTLRGRRGGSSLAAAAVNALLPEAP